MKNKDDMQPGMIDYMLAALLVLAAIAAFLAAILKEPPTW